MKMTFLSVKMSLIKIISGENGVIFFLKKGTLCLDIEHFA